MPMLELAGPSSPLRANSAEVRRVVNWEPMRIESGSGKGGAQTYLRQVAGLRLIASLGAKVRCQKVSQDRLFAITDANLLELTIDTAGTFGLNVLGSVPPGAAAVDDNETQLGITAGNLGYVFDLATSTLSPVTTNWPGSTSFNTLDGYGVLTPPGTNKFYLTTAEDFTALDPLDFTSAESSPGNIVASIVKHRQLLLLKERTAEVWYNAGDADFPFEREDAAVIDIGCAASATLVKLTGIAYWLGRDEDGDAIVFGMPGYVPQRVSSDALEEKLAALTDDQIAGARAWGYHQEGQARYVLNVPGLETTWVYNVAAALWHERGDWIEGAWQPWRATSHAFAFGMHLVGDDAGNLYELLPTLNANHEDPLRRLWRSPHDATPTANVQNFDTFEVICDTGAGLPDTGAAPSLLLRYSNDGGRTWCAWSELGMGAIGETQARVRDSMLGSARDRVWEMVVTDDVRADVVSVLVNEP